MRIFALHNPDSSIRSTSSAGGFFSMLAEETVAKGGVVYGAVFGNDWSVQHKRVETVGGIAALRGSKYAFGDFKASISLAMADLTAGREVLFSGTPCQVAAMSKIAGDNPHLLLVEVICHGAPRHDIWRRYIREICGNKKHILNDIASINFRDKKTGWKNYSFTIRFTDGSEFSQPHGDNLYMRAFLSDLTLREACFHCPFKYPDGSRADITIGDFWGISQLAPDIDNDLGTTIVIGRTTKGVDAITDIINSRDHEIRPIGHPLPFTIGELSHYNPAICSPANKPVDYEAFQHDMAINCSLIKTMRKYAGRPLRQVIHLKLARLAHRILRK